MHLTRNTSVTIAFAGLLMAGASLNGQVVTGHARDAGSGTPIPGAVVALLDSAGRTLARTVSATDGQYHLKGDGSTATIRALRIGFRPVNRTIARSDAGASITIDLAMSTLPILLDTVAVHTQAQCPARRDAQTAFGVWEAARSALLASVVARESNPPRVRVVLFKRISDIGGRLQSQAVAESVYIASQAFVSARTADAYASYGYVDRDTTGRLRTYYGPDAAVLLDPAFEEHHCFSLRNPDAQHIDEVGIEFQPTAAPDSVVDIRGTFWLGKSSPRLDSLQFEYTHLDALTRGVASGGAVAFREMANGIVLETGWHLHVPVIGTEMVRVTRGIVGTVTDVAGTDDAGGEVADAAWADGTTYRGALPLIVGRVVREGTQQPVLGAVVRVRGTMFTAVTDSAGFFQLPPIVAGKYTVDVVDTSLASLGGRLARSKDVEIERQSVAQLTIELPRRDAIIESICREEGEPKHASPGILLLGKILLPNHEAAAYATVRVRWPNLETQTNPVHAAGSADSTGSFIICGAPPGVPIMISAMLDSLTAPDDVVVVHTTEDVRRVEIPLRRVDVGSLPAYRRRALTIVGAVSRAPVADVDVTDATTDRAIGRTQATGTVSLATIPPGTALLRLRKVGYESRVITVDISPGDTSTVTIPFRTITELETVHVTAAATAAMPKQIDQTYAKAFGYLITPSDFAKANSQALLSFMTSYGLRIASTPNNHQYFSSSRSARDCAVTVYVNGLLFFAPRRGEEPPDFSSWNTNDYIAAEFYPSTGSAPMAFARTGTDTGCGILSLWTAGT